jgi:crotonobetainyl-CoA:carnitine CoA-transferase CaiB-like acyl-CoA transferase
VRPPLRVLDASGSVGGQFCAQLFANAGADVALLETSSRPLNPHLDRYLNGGKRLLAPAELSGALTTADVLLLSDTAQLAGAGRGDQVPVGLVTCTVAEFGDGPRAHWQGSELVHQALCVLAYTTGEREREPLFGYGVRAAYSAGAAAYATALAALLERDRSGRGQDTEVTLTETTAAMSMNIVAQFEYNGSWSRRSEYPGPLARLQCADGWVVLFVTPGRWVGVCAAFEMPEYAEDARFATGGPLIENWPIATELMARAALAQSAAVLVERGQAAGFAIAAVLDVTGVLDSLPEPAREHWEQLALAAPATLRATERASAGPSRAIGAPDPHRPAPLTGLRILEMTTAWAGPMLGRSLAFLGADVIKVESRTNVDAWRGPLEGGDVRRYPDLIRGERPYNRSATFNSQNTDKRSIELDLKSDDGRETMRRLVRTADVLVCNIAPGSLTRLGLDYPVLNELRPELILVEISGFGSGGPMSRHVAVGPTIEATAGMMTLLGYGDQVPQNTGGAYLDPVAALIGLGQVLAALRERADSGQGRHIEVSLRDIALTWIGEYLIEAICTGTSPRTLGNRRADAVPHGIYRCAGDDEWLGLAVGDNNQWLALCRVIGRPDLAADESLRTPAGRLARQDDLDVELRAWCATQPKRAAAAALQDAGVPAAHLANGGDLAADEHLLARGFLHELSHPETGTHRYPGLPFRLASSPGAIRRAAPCLGADGDEIRSELRSTRFG